MAVGFISYARADGEQFATELRKRLEREQPEITLWQDRARLAGGVDFGQQIRAAIDAVEYLIFVMTPAAVRSDWIRKEWQYARAQGVCICPVRGAPDEELREAREELPRWISQAHTYDLDKEWERFVLYLKSPCAATRVPFMADALPASFVPRPALFRQIVAKVLDAPKNNPSGATVVLQGFGGFGKTTLALSVCHDAEVLTACDGGILWATLGEQPSLLDELKKLYSALTGERPPFVDATEASIELSRTLEDKRCLIVIDDVWDVEHLKPFLRGAAAATRLITTRSARIAQVADAPGRVNVGELAPDEAIALLVSRLPQRPADLRPFRSLAARLGEFPLLLDLANGNLLEQIAAGATVADALDWMNRELDELGVVAFDREDATARNHAIANTIEVSLRALKDKRARCLDLGIFPDDTDVPLSVLERLWGTGAVEAQRLATRLNELSLVKLNLASRTIRMHDAVRAYLAKQLPDAAALHGRVADSWKEPARVTSPYALRYGLWHVVEAMTDAAQIPARARQLITLVTDERLREYYEKQGDVVELRRTLKRALARANDSDDASSPALIAAIGTLASSFALDVNPKWITDLAREGNISGAVDRLELFKPEPEWQAAATLLIGWLGAARKPQEAHALIEDSAAEADEFELESLLAWARLAPEGVPPGLVHPNGGPDLYQVSRIIERAGGVEGANEAIEPLNLSMLTSRGLDSSAGFIAASDGPALVAFARLDPANNTQSLQRYIAIHAANRYRYYRNRSLKFLMTPILGVPDAAWVRSMVEQLVLAALSGAAVEFRGYLPLAVKATEARAGSAEAAEQLDAYWRALREAIATLSPERGKGDSWGEYQRCASALAEVDAIGFGRTDVASEALREARELPKGFAGFRVGSALMLAEATRVALPGEQAWIDAALLSAHAASHRIQDYPFCLQSTSMVNAMRSRWWTPAGFDVEAAVGRLVENPLGPEFCAVHRVGERFEHRAHDFSTLPIPDKVLTAATLRQIADAFSRDPEVLLAANQNGGWTLDTRLPAGTDVNIPDDLFIPVLAARFAAEALLLKRTDLIQRLVPLAADNLTALDIILGRLLLSAIDTTVDLPDMLKELKLNAVTEEATPSEHLIS